MSWLGADVVGVAKSSWFLFKLPQPSEWENVNRLKSTGGKKYRDFSTLTASIALDWYEQSSSYLGTILKSKSVDEILNNLSK